MAEQEKIKLTHLLEVCLAFSKDPTPANEIKVLELTKLFIFREYIPLVEKQIAIANIVAGLPGDEYDALVSENWLTLGKTVYGILPYVVNLENDLDRVALTPAVVDLLYQMGIIDNILEHCEKDYNRLEKMIGETLNFSNLFRLAQTAEMFDTTKIDEFTKELRELKADLTPEMLEQLKSLAVSGSPEFAVLKEAVFDEAIGNAMKGDLNLAIGEAPKEEKEPEKQEEKLEGKDA